MGDREIQVPHSSTVRKGSLCMIETALTTEGNGLYHGVRQAVERSDALPDDNTAGGVLYRLEAVHRAALRLETVSDDWRCRTRKVEPENEPEGGRAQAGMFCQRPLLRFAATLTTSHRASGYRRLLTTSAAKRARASGWAARHFPEGQCLLQDGKYASSVPSQHFLLFLEMHDDIDDTQVVFQKMSSSPTS